MTTAWLSIRKPSLAVLAVCAVVALTGCHAIDFYDHSLEQPVPKLMEPPRERALMSLPSYRIAPPDVLMVEMLKLVPLPPYRAEIYDVLQIQVIGTLLDYPIDDFYLVEGEGTVNLGPAYGKVRVVGMTIEEAQGTITNHLLQVLRSPEVTVQLARASGTQPVSGQYLVTLDGTVNMRRYGSVHVAGKTVAETEAALEKHLAQFFDSPEVSVNVGLFNSKVYYVVTQGAGMGDTIVRVPISGKETVLDAISSVRGLSQLSSTKIWIARPVPGGSGCEQILPIDYESITQGAESATNYQIMPGDRVFIAQDEIWAMNILLARIAEPMQRVLGVTSLGTGTVRRMQVMGRRASQRRFF